MKAYKAMDSNMTCRGFKYELGKEYETENIEMCKRGFHACRKISDVFEFYKYDSRIFEVEMSGAIEHEGTKSVCSKIIIRREIDTLDDVGEYDKDKMLFWDSARGNLSIVEFLRDNGANIHAVDDLALRLAAENGHFPVVEFLISNGADVHAENDYALRWAAANGHFPVVEFLLAKGADVHARNDCALRWASENGHFPVVEFLIENGADIHADDEYALRWASENGHLPVVEALKAAMKKEEKRK